MRRTVLFAVLGLCLTVAAVLAGAASATPVPPVLTAPEKIVYGDTARLHATVAAASLPATFAVQSSPDASNWAPTGQVAAVMDTRTTAVDFSITPNRSGYWRIAQSSDGTTLTSNAAKILVAAKISGPYLSSPLYFGKTVLIRGQIFPAVRARSALQVVVRRWSKGKWVQDAILPATIVAHGAKPIGNDWQVKFTPTAAQIGCPVAFYAVLSDPTRPRSATPSVYRKVLCPTDARVVALTFDDGPWPSQTKAVLDILKANGVKATFFQVGVHVDAHPELSRLVLANDMPIGNHTESHLYLSTQSYSTVYKQIADDQASIKKATGFTPRWFRPPGGFTSSTVYSVAGSLGLRTVLWNVDPNDWQRPSVTTIVTRVLSQVRPGSVILMHDGGGTRTNTIEALPSIIRALKRQGYTFLTLDQLPGAEGTGRLVLK